MKNLFVLMALAGLAAFQVGCGESAPPPQPKNPGMTGPVGVVPGAPAAETKKEEGDMPKEEPAAGEEKKDEKAEEKTEEKTEEKAPEKAEDK